MGTNFFLPVCIFLLSFTRREYKIEVSAGENMSPERKTTLRTAAHNHGYEKGRRGIGWNARRRDISLCRSLFISWVSGFSYIDEDDREDLWDEWLHGHMDGGYEAKLREQEAGHLAWDA
jgi:hypothetical protein